MDLDTYIHDYSYEMESAEDQVNFHLFELRLELCHIIETITIFEIVNEVWTQQKPRYSTIRVRLLEALPYRIYMGLGKIFTTRKMRIHCEKRSIKSHNWNVTETMQIFAH